MERGGSTCSVRTPPGTESLVVTKQLRSYRSYTTCRTTSPSPCLGMRSEWNKLDAGKFLAAGDHGHDEHA